jgi:phosphohistidine phosphatase SixA
MNLLKIFIFILISLLISLKVNSSEKFVEMLKEGGKLIFIRHASAPGTGDPDNFDIKNCSTQRNLDEKGIIDSKNLGIFFSKNKIKIDIVLSSEWCRSKDTTFYAFNDYETKSFLNSFYDDKFAHNKLSQIYDLKEYIKKWNSKKNLVLVTHYVVISELLNIGALQGEIIITDENFKILGRQKIKDN